MRKKKLMWFKIVCTICILLSILGMFVTINPRVTFTLFNYLENQTINILFSLVFLVLIYTQTSNRMLIHQLFLIFIFVDTILVFNDKINFLIHVLFFALLSRNLFIILKINKKEKSIQDHLIE